MSSHTPADIRKIIDELDVMFRSSIRQGNVEEVFKKQRHALVTIFSLFYFL